MSYTAAAWLLIYDRNSAIIHFLPLGSIVTWVWGKHFKIMIIPKYFQLRSVGFCPIKSWLIFRFAGKQAELQLWIRILFFISGLMRTFPERIKNVWGSNVIKRENLLLLNTLLSKILLFNSSLFWYLWKRMNLIKNMKTLNAVCIQITHKIKMVLIIPVMLRPFSKARGCKILLPFQIFSCLIHFFHCWQTIKAILGNQGIVNVHKPSPAILKRNDDILYQSTHPRNSDPGTVASFQFLRLKNKSKVPSGRSILSMHC